MTVLVMFRFKMRQVPATVQQSHIGDASLHPVALGCWRPVGMDLVGPLPGTGRGHKYIGGLSDYFSRWPIAVPLKTKSASEVANVLNGVICSYGCFETLITDQGREFKMR